MNHVSGCRHQGRGGIDIQARKKRRIIDVAPHGLVATGIASNLDMPDPQSTFCPSSRAVTSNPLRVIDIKLQPEVIGPDLFQYVQRQIEIVQKIARHVVAVYWLDRKTLMW